MNFATPTRQVPNFAEQGRKGAERNLELEQTLNKCEENYNNKALDINSSFKTYFQQFIKMEDIFIKTLKTKK